ncbi:hypothetical protein [Nocardia sp. NPDC005366]|uniref:hypothetical protein n=1 Tax=Nocardia sp. NPDC005366 TaxID=3156878 RepID=UPI0033AD9FAA
MVSVLSIAVPSVFAAVMAPAVLLASSSPETPAPVSTTVPTDCVMFCDEPRELSPETCVMFCEEPAVPPSGECRLFCELDRGSDDWGL